MIKSEKCLNEANSLTQEKPLVSIVVITYNSFKFVLDTLESIKVQAYPNIELIVSDDCSTDNTVEVCRNWIEENKDRFVRTELVTTEKNTGIPANCNRGVKLAKGEWIKLIAGDDAFFPDAIEKVIEYLVKKPHIDVIATARINYNNNFNPENRLRKDVHDSWFFAEHMGAKQQFRKLLFWMYVNAPTVFIRRNIFYSIGFFDEQFKLIEDAPFFLKITKVGVKIHFLDIDTIKYRIHNASVCGNAGQGKLFNNFYKAAYEMHKELMFPEVNRLGRFCYSSQYHLHSIFEKLNLNKKSSFNYLLYKALYYSLPHLFYIKIMNMSRRLSSNINSIFSNQKLNM